MISYITGAILPIVALCMTSMIVDAINMKPEDETDDTTDSGGGDDDEPQTPSPKIVY